jgi:hypothetical protein
MAGVDFDESWLLLRNGGASRQQIGDHLERCTCAALGESSKVRGSCC